MTKTAETCYAYDRPKTYKLGLSQDYESVLYVYHCALILLA